MMFKEHSHKRILDTAYDMAVKNGFASLTRDGVAAAANVGMGTINHRYGTMAELKKAVMYRAVEEEQLDLIAQGLALGDEVAKSAPKDLKQKALSTLL